MPLDLHSFVPEGRLRPTHDGVGLRARFMGPDTQRDMRAVRMPAPAQPRVGRNDDIQ